MVRVQKVYMYGLVDQKSFLVCVEIASHSRLKIKFHFKESKELELFIRH
jgi:hypothetical protein